LSVRRRGTRSLSNDRHTLTRNAAGFGLSSGGPLLFRDANTGAVDLVIDRSDPDVLYAALWQARVGPVGRTESGGPSRTPSC
jgi:hypothetical protein